MPRELFDRQLSKLQDDTLALASMVDKAIDRAVQSLRSRDLELSRRVIEEDVLINRKRYDIEEEALLLVARQQPLASDLRTIVAIIHIVTDLERMADHAEGIAKINIMLGQQPLVKPLIDIPRMAEKARSMLARAIDTFIERNAEEAKRISAEDDEVDALYDQIYHELLAIMIRDPKQISGATYLLWVAHNLERIADRVTNICERVVFMVTGQMAEMNVSKY